MTSASGRGGGECQEARNRLVAKKLRLAAAGLTDVGRRRERNQDHVSHQVPSDERVLEDKGALFVVCDGMGGHAAGEVASQMVVESLLEAYYSGADSDIITAVANAIKQANQAVFRYASEHPEMKGMGTTCVALVVHGGRAYFVNIGDSRGYLVRNGVLRQITLDHSWVAEQVRAGLLSEEQARTHAHRNVITRSVGTQPNVSADLFIETLRDGDRVLLCSDGLHGYVDEEFIEREMTTHDEPGTGAQHLINMANDNGGPDNITALVIHLLEVPEVTGEVKLPPSVEGEEQVITQPLPAITRVDELPAAQKVVEKAKRRGKRKRSPAAVAAATALRIMALAAILCLAVGGWDFTLGPYAHSRAAASQLHSDIAALRVAVQQASGSQDPAQSLASLGAARDRVIHDLRNSALDSQSADAGRAALADELAPAVRTEIQNYDRAALVAPVNVSSAQVYDLACAIPGQTAPVAFNDVTQMAALASNSGSASGVETLFAISGGQLYQLQAPVDSAGVATFGSLTCGVVSVPGVSSALSVSTQGATVYVLGQQSSGQSLIVPLQTSGFNKDGTANVKAQPSVTPALPAGASAQQLAVDGPTTYVSYKGGSSSAAGILIFPTANAKAPAKSMPLSQPALDVTATGGLVYAVLADGTIAQLDPARGVMSLPYQAPKPIPPELITTYTGDSPVPTVSDATQPASGNLALLADPAIPTHILLADAANNRVVRLSYKQGSASADLVTQYVYSAPVTGITQFALTSNGNAVTVYGWNGNQIVAFVAPENPSGA